MRKTSFSLRKKLALSALIAGSLFGMPSAAQAQNYWWDGNDNVAGFGTAGGTWAVPTTGTLTSGWSTDSTGLTIVDANSVTTLLTDTLNFGNLADGLAAGTITVSGTVDAGNLTFASGSGAIDLSGGTINLGAAAAVTVDNATDTISSIISGAGTSLTKAGTGTLVLSGVNTYTGTTILSSGILRATTSASALGGGGLSMAVGTTLQLANNSALNFGRATTLTGGAGTVTFVSDRLANGAGLTHTLGTLSTSTGAKTIVLNAGSFRTTGTAGLTFGTVTMGSNTVFTTNANTQLNLGAVNGPTFSLTKNGTGTLNLTAAGNYTGGTFLNAGTIRATAANSMGAGGTLTIATGTTLQLANNTAQNYARPVVFANGAATINFQSNRTSNGAGVTHTLGTLLTGTGAKTVILTQDNFATSGTQGLLFGAVTMQGATTFTSNNSGTTTTLLTLPAVTNGGSLLTINGTGNTNITGVISGNGGLTKGGTGTLNLTGNNTFTGTTTLSAGTLRAQAAGGLGGTTGTVAITQGSTLQLANNGNTNYGRNVTLAAAAGTVTFDSDRVGNGGGTTLTLGTLATGTGAKTIILDSNQLGFATSGTQNLAFGAVTLGSATTFTVNNNGLAAAVLQLGAVGGNHAITKNGTGTLAFNGAGTFTTGVTINAGQVNLGNAAGLGTAAGGTIVASGAALNVNAQNVTAAEPLSILGTGLAADPRGALTNANGTAATWGGPVTLAGAATIGSSAAGGLTLSSAATVDTAGNPLTIAISGSGRIFTDGDIFGTGAVIVNGSSTGDYVPRGLHTYSGGTTLNAGSFLAVDSSSTGTAGNPTAGPFGSGVTPLILNGAQLRSGTGGDRTIGNTVTLQADTTFYTVGSEKNLVFSGPVTITGADRTLNSAVGFTVPGKTVRFDGAIGDGAGVFGLTKSGLGNVTLAGANTYDGPTNVSAGTLHISGSIANGTALTVAGGASLLMNSNTGTPLAFSTGINLGTAAQTATLALELGNSTATSDTFSTVGAATAAGNVVFNIYALPTFNGTTATYDLVTAASGLNGATYALGPVVPGGATYSLTNNDMAVQLSVTSSLITGPLYWRGAVNSSWGALNAGNTNFTTDLAGANNAGIAPDADNSVIFGATTAPFTSTTVIATTLDTNFAVKDLTFSSNPAGITAVSIAAGGNIMLPTPTLTITPAAATDGIDVASNAGAVTISAPVILGASQSWDVDGTGANGSSLNVSGDISGGALTTLDITSSNGGIVTLSGTAKTYSGQTNIPSGGTLQSGAVNSFSPNSVVNVTGTGILQLNGISNTIANLTGNGVVQNNHAATAATLTFGDANPATFSGTIQNGSGGTLGITKQGAGAVTLTSTNTYTGATTISAGTLIAGNATAFNNTSALTVSGTGILDLNGFGATFTGMTAGANTATITDNAAGAGVSTLNLSLNPAVTISTLITDGATRDVALRVINNNASTQFNIANMNTFSGGLTLAYDSVNAPAGTRLQVSAAITGTPLGSGPITVGEGPTDKAGIIFTGADNTIASPIVMNTSLGTDRFGIRNDGRLITFSGLITANSDVVFSANSATANNNTITTGITGAGGLVIDLSQTSTNNSKSTVTLNTAANASNYSGDTIIGRADVLPTQANFTATLALGASDQIPNGIGRGNVILNNDTATRTGTLNLSGFSDTINGLSGNGTVEGATTGTPTNTLTFGDNNATGFNFSGVIQDTAGTLSITKIGGGTQTLSGTNTFDGAVSVNGGTLNFATAANLGNAAALTNVVNLNGGTLNYTAPGGVTLGATRSVTIGGSGGTISAADSVGTLTIDGGINPASTGSLTKTGLGTVTVANSTDLNGGNVTVSAGVLNAGFIADGLGAINVANGGTLNLYDNATTTMAISGLTLAAGSSLGFDLNAPTVNDVLNLTGTASVTPNVSLNFNDLGGLAAGTYDLINVTAGTLTNTNYVLGLAPSGFNYVFSTLDLGAGPNTTLRLTTSALTQRYWTGDQDGNWNTDNGPGNTNWASDASGTELGALPVATDTLVFSATTAVPVAGLIATSLNNVPVTADSLRFVNAPTTPATTDVTVASGGAGGILTINPVSSNNGITVAGLGGNVVISAPVVAAANQTWEVVGTAPSSLNVSGDVTFTSSVTKSGAGILTLSGNNSGSGGVNLVGGVLNINSATALGSGTFAIESGTTIDSTVPLITIGNTQSWNGSFAFTGSQDLNLGTGAVTLGSNVAILANAGILTVGGAIGDGGNNRSLTKAGAGTVTLNGVNTFGGGVTLAGGVLNINNTGALGAGTLTGAGGSIDNTSAGTMTVTNALDLSGNLGYVGSLNPMTLSASVSLATMPTITVLNNTLTLSGNYSGLGGLNKAGAGTLVLSGINTYEGDTTVAGGTLNVTGTLTGMSGGQLQVGTAAGNSVINVSNNISGVARYQGATVASSNAAYNQTAGIVTLTSTATANPTNVVASAGYGYFNLTGGTFISRGRFAPSNGPATTGVMYIGGGGVFDQTTGEWLLMAYSATGNGGLASITLGPGGTLNRNGASNNFGLNMDRNNGYAVLNIAGGSMDNGIRAVTFGNGTVASTNTTGMLSLAGGDLTIRTAMLNGNSTGSGNKAFLNFAGGKLNAGAAIAAIIPVGGANQTFTSTLYGPISNNNANSINNASQDFVGGLTVDTMGFNSGFTNALLAPTANGVTSATLGITGGSGYIGAPMVQFTGGTLAAGGAPATGYALISGGAVTGIVITSPGSYDVAPTVTLTGGGGSGAAVTVGALLANTSGGLTKTGLGTLTLSGVNTYTGSTTIDPSSDTLAIGGAGQLGAGNYAGAISIGNGSTFQYGSTAAQTISGLVSGTGSLLKTNTGTLTVSGANAGFSGPISLNGGIINVTTNNNALGSNTVTFNGGVRLLLGDGITLANPIVIGANAGAAGNGLIQYTGATSATASGPITINNGAAAGGHFASTGGGVLNVTGVITSSAQVSQRDGTVMFSGGGTGYTAMIQTGTTIVGANDGIATTALVTLGGSGNGTVDLNGFNQSLAGIARNANTTVIGNSSTTTDSTLTITGASVYSGTIVDVVAPGTRTVSLVKSTAGTLELSAANTFTGGTTVSGGTLLLSTAVNRLSTTGAITVNGGTLNLGTFGQTTSGNVSFVSGTISNGTLTKSGADYDGQAGTVSAILNGGVGLVKTTAGVLTLSNTNGYTGTTTVNAGTLDVTGSLANNNFDKVSIAAPDATLAGNPILTRATPGSYAGIGSTVVGGVGGTAEILNGTNSSGTDTSLSMQWRLRTASESSSPTNPPLPNGVPLMSEVLSLTGMGNGGAPVNGYVQTDPFVLQMSYDPTLTTNESDNRLVTFDTTSGLWVNAIDGNFTGSYMSFQRAYDAGIDGLMVGRFGVDTVNNVVWAVLDHNSEFAVIPEPSTLVLGGLALLGFAGVGLRRRRMAKQSA